MRILNSDDADHPALGFVEHLEIIVDQQGERIAIVDGDRRLTYRQLWELSQRMAIRLQQAGVCAESVVALRLEKSADSIAAMVAVWRCRAAWVPVDPFSPEQRLDFLIGDSGAALVIDQEWLELLQHAAPDSGSAFSTAKPFASDQLAYVIYTSGTTGQPKGVEITQRGLVSMLTQQIDAIGMTPDSRSLFLLSVNFDASVSDIGTALLAGASLWIDRGLFSKGRLTATPNEILDSIDRNRITYVDIPPAVLAKMDPAECPKSLSTVLIGGEVCPPEVVRKWADQVRLLNVYGPTEATVCTSIAIGDSSWQRPQIGTPLTGVQYAIDAQDAANPRRGELLIGGPQLARGYRNLPDETRRKFIHRDGQTFYRSGDLVEVADNGQFVFLGRIDRQIKVRGHRIEPEEVEQTLLSHPQIARAAVVLRAPSTNATSESILAFVEANDDTDPHILLTELRDCLAARLPHHCRPGHIEIVSAMPLTASGKPDLSALQQRPEAQIQHENRCASTDIEGVLFNAFGTTLGHRQFDADSSFFDIGGDSLRTLEVAAIAQTFGFELFPHLIATHESIRKICEAMAGESNAESVSAESLRKDVVRLIGDPLKPFQKGNATLDSEDILLTGATGFLGSRLLQSLTQTATVSCLIRAQDNDEARDRLEQSLNTNRVFLSDQQWTKIECIAGDISKPNLGLSQLTHDSLAQTIDHIVHAAAEVNSAKTCSQLWPANVLGTWEVVKFAAAGKLKKLDYISTLSVFVGTDRFRGTMLENDDLSQTSRVYGGYAQSKFAAEILVQKCAAALPQSRIFRLGLLTADRSTGVFPTSDLLTLAVKGCLELQMAPVLSETLRFDVTPVDFAADVLGEIFLSAEFEPVYHIAHPRGASANDLCEALVRVSPELELVDAAVFLDRVRRSQLDPTISAACIALATTNDSAHRSQPASLDLFQATDTMFDMSHTEKHMEQANIEFAEIDVEFLRNMIQPMCPQRESN